MQAVLSARPLPSESDLHQITSLVLTEVARRLGRTSRWNGELYVLRRPPSASAAAMADGRLALNRDDVLRPFTDALGLRRRDRALPPGLAERLRQAFDTLVHEGCHLAAPAHPTDSAGLHAIIGVQPDPEVEATVSIADRIAAGALHEGLVRLWTRQNLDAVLEQLGLDEVFPEVCGRHLRPGGQRPALLALGAQAVVDELSEVTGYGSDAVLHQLVTARPGRGWATAADLIIETRPAGQIPATERAGVRTRLFDVGRSAYGAVVSAYLQPDRSRDAAWQVSAAGRSAVRAALAAAGSDRPEGPPGQTPA